MSEAPKFFSRGFLAGLIAFALLMSAPAEGQAKRKKRGKKGRIVSVDFDDELRIKGRLMGPSIFSLFQKKELNYGKLIKPREHFLPEMRRTLEDID